jgi:hypothetical protein
MEHVVVPEVNLSEMVWALVEKGWISGTEQKAPRAFEDALRALNNELWALLAALTALNRALHAGSVSEAHHVPIGCLARVQIWRKGQVTDSSRLLRRIPDTGRMRKLSKLTSTKVFFLNYLLVVY